MSRYLLIAFGWWCIGGALLAAEPAGFAFLKPVTSNQKPQVGAVPMVLVKENVGIALMPEEVKSPQAQTAEEVKFLLMSRSRDQGQVSPTGVLLPGHDDFGLVRIKVEPGSGLDQLVVCSPAAKLQRGETIQWFDEQGKSFCGAYVGEEYKSSAGTIFILPLLQVRFSEGNIPSRGAACFTSEGNFVGFVLGSRDKGKCYVLPSDAVVFFAHHPATKKVRLGCQLDVNATIPEIVEVTPQGPMDQAGVLPGDILISFNGHSVEHYSDFLKAVYYAAPCEQPIRVEVLRNTKRIEIKSLVPAPRGAAAKTGQK